MTTSDYLVIHEAGSVPIKLWTRGVPVESASQEQLKRLAAMPLIYRHIAVMPDVHLGEGTTIGTVFASQRAVIPSAVGVDIGCGMVAAKTNLLLVDIPPQARANIRAAIEARVPHGRSHHGSDQDEGAWRDPATHIRSAFETQLGARFKAIVGKYPLFQQARTVNHLGTLGTGNHFIEICHDQDEAIWIMLHSGSRGIGNRIGSTFSKLAQREAEAWMLDLPHPSLAYLPRGTELFDDYMMCVSWAQDFAALNRDIMLEATLEALRTHESEAVITSRVDCHHNYIAWEHHFNENVLVTRKGAVRARTGDLGIIPGSMGARSYIVEGLGNPESFTSCSHGAGRVMSRTEAKSKFSMAEHAAAVKGVECRLDAGVIDETPMAYKDIDTVMEAQRSLCKPVAVLKQIICVKG